MKRPSDISEEEFDGLMMRFWFTGQQPPEQKSAAMEWAVSTIRNQRMLAQILESGSDFVVIDGRVFTRPKP